MTKTRTNRWGWRRDAADRALTEAPPAEPDFDHQDMAISIIDAFTEYDVAALAGATAAEREKQWAARRALHDHVSAIWEGAKARGLNPAIRPEWAVVAGMVDLTQWLSTEALMQIEKLDEESS